MRYWSYNSGLVIFVSQYCCVTLSSAAEKEKQFQQELTREQVVSREKESEVLELQQQVSAIV